MFWNLLKKKPERIYQYPERKISYAAKSISIKADPNRIGPDIEKYIRAQIMVLDDIPKRERKFVADQMVEAIKEGNNLHRAAWALEEVGVERKRASEISEGISHQATTKINLARQLSLGLTEGEWLYSGSLCFVRFPGDKEGERRGREHEEANGKRFKLSEGLMVGGSRTWPGMEWGCKCVWTIVIPGEK